MSYIPKYILKRMFKKDECLQIVTYEGEEWVQLQMINVISPLEVPEGPIDLGGIKLPDAVGDYLKIKVNGADVSVTPDMLVNSVLIWHEGKKYDFKAIIDDHAAGGLTIAVGQKLTLLIKKSAFPEGIVKEGAIEVSVEVALDNPINVTVKANAKGTGDFDPSNT